MAGGDSELAPQPQVGILGPRANDGKTGKGHTTLRIVISNEPDRASIKQIEGILGRHNPRGMVFDTEHSIESSIHCRPPVRVAFGLPREDEGGHGVAFQPVDCAF